MKERLFITDTSNFNRIDGSSLVGLYVSISRLYIYNKILNKKKYLDDSSCLAQTTIVYN